jgi:N-acetylmuramic acid 6-phosphate etherase
MVDMQARNAKLRARAVRMLRCLADCSPDEAQAALQTAGGRVKLAVLIVRGMALTDAEALLARHQGNLRAALVNAPTR